MLRYLVHVLTLGPPELMPGTIGRQVSLPLKPPPQPDPADNWSYLRLALRPLDPTQLKDTLSTPEGEFVVSSLGSNVSPVT